MDENSVSTAVRCSECRFYRPEWSRGWNQEPHSWQGDCVRFPPTITGSYRTAPNNNRTQRLGEWPLVEAAWWCGEFEVKLEP